MGQLVHQFLNLLWLALHSSLFCSSLLCGGGACLVWMGRSEGRDSLGNDGHQLYVTVHMLKNWGFKSWGLGD